MRRHILVRVFRRCSVNCTVHVILEFERVDHLSGCISLLSIPVCAQGRPRRFFHTGCVVPLHIAGDTLRYPRLLLWKLASWASLSMELHLITSWSLSFTQECKKSTSILVRPSATYCGREWQIFIPFLMKCGISNRHLVSLLAALWVQAELASLLLASVVGKS